MSAAESTLTVDRTPYDGGRRAFNLALGLGVIGLLGTAAIGFASPTRALYSYLWAYFYWFSIAVGSLGWLCAFWAAKARWVVLPRRLLELNSSTVALFAVLFLPVVFGMSRLFNWVHPEGEPEAVRKLFEHRAIYLNRPFFLGRAVFYFVVFIAVSRMLSGWSQAQDTKDDPANVIRSWKLSSAALPVVGLAITFAAFDWLMSLKAEWYSTMFGLYIIAGGVLAAMATWILTARFVGLKMSGHHWHSMGKLLFAFVCFWAYTGFSQFLLIWIADLPEEGPWYHMRMFTPWSWVGLVLIVFHFVVPFIILLSRDLKFNPRKLSVMAVWILIVHAIDLYWIVLPQFSPDGPHPSLTDLLAIVGVGGAAIAFALWRMRGRVLVAVNDPFLKDSLEYHP